MLKGGWRGKSARRVAAGHTEARQGRQKLVKSRVAGLVSYYGVVNT